MSKVLYGNYHGYYTKRPFPSDQRLLVLPPGLFKDARVLDVGCNEGWLTSEIGEHLFIGIEWGSTEVGVLGQLAQSYGAKVVVGVDIDNTLIQAAWRRRRAVWSLQKPTLPQSHETSGLLESTQTRNYFPASCEHEFGFLPIPPSVNRTTHVFPHNLLFRTADWVRTVIPEDKEGYDVVIGFSITKWIHLNAGDEGLINFFRRVFDVLRPAGKFVVEPQPWDSYGKAKRGNTKLKEKAADIQLKPEEFGKTLEGIGFQRVGTFVVRDGIQGFQRPIDMYIKQ